MIAKRKPQPRGKKTPSRRKPQPRGKKAPSRRKPATSKKETAPQDPVDLSEVTLSNRAIVLPSGVRSVLGPSVVLRDCRIELPRDAELLIADATFVRCSFKAHLQKEQYWSHASWVECRFEGTFHRTSLGPYQPGEGEVKDCDFRDANLHDFVLRNCAPEGCSFAPWPTFVVLHPAKNKLAIRAVKWPGWMTFIMTVDASLSPSKTAIVMNAELVLKDLARHGTKTTVAVLRKALAQLGPAVILDGGNATRKARSLN